MKTTLPALLFVALLASCASGRARQRGGSASDENDACVFASVVTIDRVDSSCIGPPITDARKHNIIGAYFQAMVRSDGRPYLADLAFDRDEARFTVCPYKTLKTGSGSEQSYFLSVAFEDAQHEAVLLGPDSSYSSKCLILYEQVLGEEEYRLTTVRHGDTITQRRAVSLASGPAKSSAGSGYDAGFATMKYIRRDGHWVNYFEQASGPVQPSGDSRNKMTSDGTRQASFGTLDKHTKHGAWVEWTYSFTHDSLVKWTGTYEHGLRHGPWTREAAGKAGRADRYDHGRLVRDNQR